jgi:hypothetical protein
MSARNWFYFIIAGLSVSALTLAPVAADAKAKKKKPVAAAKGAKGTAVAKAPALTEDNKKALDSLHGGFKMGMSKDEVVGALSKQLDANYDEKLRATTDVYQQDGLRREKKTELRRITDTYIEFNGKRTGWDVSIVENEFAHKTGEAMLVYWENANGKNQRRFFFFVDGRLYKMFISLDTSFLPVDKRNFETFKAAMFGQYGAGLVDVGKIDWNVGTFTVTALDKLRNYDALALIITDPATNRTLAETRKANAPAKQGPSQLTKMVLEKDGDQVDVNANSGAADAVIKANGGKAPVKGK